MRNGQSPPARPGSPLQRSESDRESAAPPMSACACRRLSRPRRLQLRQTSRSVETQHPNLPKHPARRTGRTPALPLGAAATTAPRRKRTGGIGIACCVLRPLSRQPKPAVANRGRCKTQNWDSTFLSSERNRRRIPSKCLCRETLCRLFVAARSTRRARYIPFFINEIKVLIVPIDGLGC